MDPRKINESLKREHLEMPRREDIEAELAGAKYFSRLDANSGFHQIPLHEETSRICTFATPFGRYRFRVYVDDILVWGSTREEHDDRLRTVLEAARKAV